MVLLIKLEAFGDLHIFLAFDRGCIRHFHREIMDILWNRKKQIDMSWIKGHTSQIRNEQADEMASDGTEKEGSRELCPEQIIYCAGGAAPICIISTCVKTV